MSLAAIGFCAMIRSADDDECDRREGTGGGVSRILLISYDTFSVFVDIQAG